MNITYEEFENLLTDYDAKDKEMIERSYEYAKILHNGQYRESGEEYIVHPLNVAYILAEMHADCDTICAGLLHDTIEDTAVTKKDIASNFNEEIANLVDGVTKLAKMNFSSKEAQKMANTRKIITSITTDVRIIIIKLADRLHNMRTLEYKKEFKQKENSLETLDIFVPLAYYIGAYRIKQELEDISFKYIYPYEYENIENRKKMIEAESEESIKEMLYKIGIILGDKNIPYDIKVRTKNIYGIYKKMEKGEKISEIHDLIALKIMVHGIDNCYRTLGAVHSLYHPLNDKFRDYICNPKTNMYQSLHTTVFAPYDRLVQAQIRTYDMDKVASFGLATYWDLNKGSARFKMQQDLKNKYQFFKSLSEINAMFSDNKEFVSQVKEELFSDKVYVYTSKGDIIELPKGATLIDFAYKIHSDIGDTMVGGIVNDEFKEVNYVLENNDRVRIITDELARGPINEWLGWVKTSYAKKRIKECMRKR